VGERKERRRRSACSHGGGEDEVGRECRVDTAGQVGLQCAGRLTVRPPSQCQLQSGTQRSAQTQKCGKCAPPHSYGDLLGLSSEAAAHSHANSDSDSFSDRSVTTPRPDLESRTVQVLPNSESLRAGSVGGINDHLVEHQSGADVHCWLLMYVWFLSPLDMLHWLLGQFEEASVERRENLLRFLHKWIHNCFARDIATRAPLRLGALAEMGVCDAGEPAQRSSLTKKTRVSSAQLRSRKQQQPYIYKRFGARGSQIRTAATAAAAASVCTSSASYTSASTSASTSSAPSSRPPHNQTNATYRPVHPHDSPQVRRQTLHELIDFLLRPRLAHEDLTCALKLLLLHLDHQWECCGRGATQLPRFGPPSFTSDLALTWVHKREEVKRSPRHSNSNAHTSPRSSSSSSSSSNAAACTPSFSQDTAPSSSASSPRNQSSSQRSQSAVKRAQNSGSNVDVSTSTTAMGRTRRSNTASAVTSSTVTSSVSSPASAKQQRSHQHRPSKGSLSARTQTHRLSSSSTGDESSDNGRPSHLQSARHRRRNRLSVSIESLHQRGAGSSSSDSSRPLSSRSHSSRAVTARQHHHHATLGRSYNAMHHIHPKLFKQEANSSPTPREQSDMSRPEEFRFNVKVPTAYLDFMAMNVKELAHLFTEYEFGLFCTVTEGDLLDWLSNPEHPKICLMTERFNQLSFWIATHTLMESNLNRAAALVKKFIYLTYTLLELNNFNTAMSVLAGLNLHCVQRLDEIWDLVPESTKTLFHQMEKVLRPHANFRNYRQLLETRSLPILPYFGLFLRDLTFIDDGNETFVEQNLVNFEKVRLFGQLFSQLQYFQMTHYPPSFVNESNLTRAQLKIIQDLPSLNRDQLEMLSDERKPRRPHSSSLVSTTSAPSVLNDEERALLPPAKLVIDI